MAQLVSPARAAALSPGHPVPEVRAGPFSLARSCAWPEANLCLLSLRVWPSPECCWTLLAAAASDMLNSDTPTAPEALTGACGQNGSWKQAGGKHAVRRARWRPGTAQGQSCPVCAGGTGISGQARAGAVTVGQFGCGGDREAARGLHQKCPLSLGSLEDKRDLKWPWQGWLWKNHTPRH